MVGKAKSIGHTSNAINYGKDKLNAEEISRHNVIGNTGLEIENEFKVYQNLNSNTRLNTFSVVLSPEPEDGRRLTSLDFKEICESYLEKMNLQEHQHIAFLHKDREHAHLHLYVNRIDNCGKAYNDSFLGKKTWEKATEISKERGLISARDKMLQNIEKNRNNLKEIKAEIYKKHQEVLKQNPQGFQDYIKQMNLKGLEVQPSIDLRGEIRGFRILHKETKNDFKASECHRSMSATKLFKSGLKNDLNAPLNRIEKKRTPKIALNKNTAIQIKHGLKTELKQVKNISEFQVKSTGKSLLKTFVKTPKMTKEEFKEELKFEKHLDEVVNPHLIITMNESSADSQKANELSKIQDEKIQIEKDKNDEPKINNLKLEQDFGI